MPVDGGTYTIEGWLVGRAGVSSAAPASGEVGFKFYAGKTSLGSVGKPLALGPDYAVVQASKPRVVGATEVTATGANLGDAGQCLDFDDIVIRVAPPWPRPPGVSTGRREAKRPKNTGPASR